MYFEVLISFVCINKFIITKWYNIKTKRDNIKNNR